MMRGSAEVQAAIEALDAARGDVALRAAVLDAARVLDPDRQGAQWPDPIEWDGRPLAEQASDLRVLLAAMMEG